MIGIICAMQLEADKIQKEMQITGSERVSGMEFVRGSLCGQEIVLAVCGIGKVFAAVCAEAMILRYAPACILNSGVAGTLTDKLSIGDIAVADKLVQHDMDTTALGDPPGLISGINTVYFEADPRVCRMLEAAADAVGAKSYRGTIASGDQFMSDPEKKARIRDMFGAIACEMEGAAVAQAAYVNNIPFCVLRAISDSADGQAQMEYPKFAAMAAERSFAILREFLLHFQTSTNAIS